MELGLDEFRAAVESSLVSRRFDQTLVAWSGSTPFSEEETEDDLPDIKIGILNSHTSAEFLKQILR